MANTADSVTNDLVPIHIFNGTSWFQEIKRGERLATFESWDDSMEIIDYDFESDISHHPHLSSCKKASSSTHHGKPDIDWSKSEVTETQRQQLKDLVNEFSDSFVDPVAKELGLTNPTSCKI